MELPYSLIEQVRERRVVLFLGAGATIGATKPDGKPVPLGNALRDALSIKFLGGQHQDGNLAWVAELSESATDLFTVQDFIADTLRDLQPAAFHALIPTFPWRGLATTNYDLLIETVYNTNSSRVPLLVPFLSNSDRVDEKLREKDNVGYIKLHGCLTRTHDSHLPLILTPDQYVTHNSNRERLYRTLTEWATENTLLFVGHELYDADVRAIVLRLSKDLPQRPRYYLVKPNVKQIESDFWASKRITVISGTFEKFLSSLDEAIPQERRQVLRMTQPDHPVRLRFRTTSPPSKLILDLLNHDAEYVHSGIQYTNADPKKFYSGFDLGWGPVIDNLDVRRSLVDRILSEVVLRPEEDRPTIADLYVIKAAAGSGKSTVLRRIAWEAATGADELCLFATQPSTPSLDALAELARVTDSRIFLFIDDAADNTTLIKGLVSQAREEKVRLTLLTAERVNEWNVSCTELAGLISDEYDLHNLNQSEIHTLVTLLAKHNAAGPRLKKLSIAEQVHEFEERAGRQLLVALHEATLGIPFEEILLNEFEQITPDIAKALYLTVCVLNRMRVPVRAGLIARVHGITFDDFKERLFAPLEHVVKISQGTGFSDYNYTARHPEIAQIVFDRVLTKPDDRFNEYSRIIRHLNISYSSDRSSFRGLVRARGVIDLFPDDQDAQAVFALAKEAVGEESYLYQQMANYERIRRDGDLDRAEQLISKARDLDPLDHSLVHTAAEISRSRAEASARALERQKHRRHAKTLLAQLISIDKGGSYNHATMVKLAMDDLRDLLQNESATDKDLGDSVRNVDKLLTEAQQLFPDESHLATLEIDFATMLKDSERTRRALKKAFEINKRDSHIATRIAELYRKEGNIEDAEAALKGALESNRGDRKLNFQYAMLLREISPEEHDLLAYYFRRAFTRQDENYSAQFWFARHAYESMDENRRRESREVFQYLRSAPIDHNIRVRIHDIARRDGERRTFTGTVLRIESSHGFITIDGTGDSIFFHRSDSSEDSWRALSIQMRVSFGIGYTMGGARGINVMLVGSPGE